MKDFAELARPAAAEEGGEGPAAQKTSNGTLSDEAQAEARHISGADIAVGEERGDSTGGQTSTTAAEEESTAHFEPVVQLDEVEVKTHEEDEECLFKMRAKLFVFGETLLNKGTGSKSWNERGIGDIKFLKHKEHGKIRVLMRQEKTMKVISNHVIDPRIVVLPNAGSDRSWVWTAFDYAEGDLAETTFAIRFANSEAAIEFRDQYEACKKEMQGLLEGEEAEGEEGEKAADEASAAIESLSVNDEKEKKSHNDSS